MAKTVRGFCHSLHVYRHSRRVAVCFRGDERYCRRLTDPAPISGSYRLRHSLD